MELDASKNDGGDQEEEVIPHLPLEVNSTYTLEQLHSIIAYPRKRNERLSVRNVKHSENFGVKEIPHEKLYQGGISCGCCVVLDG